MKRILSIFLTILVCFSIGACSCKKEENVPTLVTLEDEQYTKEGEGFVQYLGSYALLKEKIDSKSNFVLFMYGAACTGCIKFTPILQEYVKEKGIKIYAIEVMTLEKENKELKEKLQTTPAVAIIKEGEVYQFIQGYGKEDSLYFESKEGFGSWFEKYVIIEK